MLGIFRVSGQEFAGITGAQDSNGLVAGGLSAFGVERDQLVPYLAGVLVDRGEQRGRLRQPQIGLVERDLGRINGLGFDNAPFRNLTPVLCVRGLALPQGRHRHAVWCRDNNAIGVPLKASTGDFETELVAMTIAGPEIEPRLAKPVDRQILKHMSKGENSERLTSEPGAFVLWNLEILVLQPALTGITKSAATQIIRYCNLMSGNLYEVCA